MVSARLCAAVFAFLGILAAVEVQAANSSDCTGVVLDENGVPVGTAKIKLEHDSGREYRAETNDAGRFMFQNLPAGDYKVEVRKEGFFLLTDYAITLHTGNNELSLTLNHAQELHEQVQVTVRPDQIDPPGDGPTIHAHRAGHSRHSRAEHTCSPAKPDRLARNRAGPSGQPPRSGSAFGRDTVPTRWI